MRHVKHYLNRSILGLDNPRHMRRPGPSSVSAGTVSGATSEDPPEDNEDMRTAFHTASPDLVFSFIDPTSSQEKAIAWTKVRD